MFNPKWYWIIKVWFRLSKKRKGRLHGWKLAQERLAQTEYEVYISDCRSNKLLIWKNLCRIRPSYQNLRFLYSCEAQVSSLASWIQWIIRIRRICHIEGNRWSEWGVIQLRYFLNYSTHRCSLRYETISDLMGLQDQIESFQKTVFSHFHSSNNNECRISALVPLVKESWGIYRFITSMLRAMFRSAWIFSIEIWRIHGHPSPRDERSRCSWATAGTLHSTTL